MRAAAWPSRNYGRTRQDRKSTRLNSSHDQISYAVFCLKKKKKQQHILLENKRTKVQLITYHEYESMFLIRTSKVPANLAHIRHCRPDVTQSDKYTITLQ